MNLRFVFILLVFVLCLSEAIFWRRRRYVPPPCSWSTCRHEWRNDWNPGIQSGRCVYQNRKAHHIITKHSSKGMCPSTEHCGGQSQSRTMLPQAPAVAVGEVIIPALPAAPAADGQQADNVPADAENQEIANLLQRIKALESRQSSSVESSLANLASYGMRPRHDFDKYTALSMAEDLVAIAHHSKHEKASFISAAARALRDRVDKSLEQFQAYFLALFSDKDYSRVLESIAKVDKSLRAADPLASSSPSPPVRPSSRSGSRIICHFCGVPGHTSPFCYKKRDQSARPGRFAPYRRSPRGRDGPSPQ